VTVTIAPPAKTFAQEEPANATTEKKALSQGDDAKPQNVTVTIAPPAKTFAQEEPAKQANATEAKK
jgi:hypothetical protein